MVQAPEVCGERSSLNSSEFCQTFSKPPSARIVPGVEVVVDRERARVDLTHRVDQAHDPSGTAQVQPRQRLAERGEVEERVTGQDVLTVGHQPVVEDALLLGQRVQLVPHVRATARGPQPGQAQRRAVLVRQGLELVELGHVLPGHDDRDLGVLEPGVRRFFRALIAVS